MTLLELSKAAVFAVRAREGVMPTVLRMNADDHNEVRGSQVFTGMLLDNAHVIAVYVDPEMGRGYVEFT